MNVSQKIYKLRTEKEMTQAQMAKIAGVSDKAVSAWESGTRDPKLKAIQNICAYFNLDMNSFVDETLDDFAPSNSARSSDIMRSESDDFRRRLIAVLSKLDASEWELLERVARKLSAENGDEPTSGEHYLPTFSEYPRQQFPLSESTVIPSSDGQVEVSSLNLKKQNTP